MEADLSAELPDEALVGTGLSLHPMETEVTLGNKKAAGKGKSNASR